MGESATSAAVCRVCGHRHWMRDPHIWGDEPKKKVLDVLRDEIKRVAPVVVHAEKVVHASKHGRYADTEKRREYRREWMKRKRELDRQQT